MKNVDEVLSQWDRDIAEHKFLVEPSLDALHEAMKAEEMSVEQEQAMGRVQKPEEIW